MFDLGLLVVLAVSVLFAFGSQFEIIKAGPRIWRMVLWGVRSGYRYKMASFMNSSLKYKDPELYEELLAGADADLTFRSYDLVGGEFLVSDTIAGTQDYGRVAADPTRQTQFVHTTRRSAPLLFNSLTFVAFFAVVLALHNAPLPWKVKKTNLLLASYLFYAAWNPPFVILLWLSTVVDWHVAKKIYATDSASRTTKSLLDTARWEYDRSLQEGDEAAIERARQKVNDLDAQWLEDRKALELLTGCSIESIDRRALGRIEELHTLAREFADKSGEREGKDDEQ